MLPWVVRMRDKILADTGNRKISEAHLSCETCSVPRFARESWRCGYLPDQPSERRYTGPMGQDWPIVPTTCPGYTTSLPQVYEAARARKWAERGMLRDLEDDDLNPVMLAAIDILDIGISEVEQAEIGKAKNGS